jgi:hypothetical protein
MRQVRQWARDHKRSAVVLGAAAFLVIAAAGSALGIALAAGPAPDVAACRAALHQADLAFEQAGKPVSSQGAALKAACQGIPDAQYRQLAYQVARSG